MDAFWKPKGDFCMTESEQFEKAIIQRTALIYKIAILDAKLHGKTSDEIVAILEEKTEHPPAIGSIK
jgi:hypothetical protein